MLLVAASASAEVTYYATLAPTPAASGSTASGSATLVLNDAETALSYNIVFSGLAGPETAAHIHRPDGTLAHHLPLRSPKIGTYSGLGSLDVMLLKAGQLYILLHSESYPGGELKGFITESQVPVEGKTWGAVKSAYASALR